MRLGRGRNGAARGATSRVAGPAEANLLGKHDDLQHVAADATSETPPGSCVRENVKVWTTAVGMKRTTSDERPPLAFELDAIAPDNIFDRVRLLQGSRVNPPRSGPNAGGWRHHARLHGHGPQPGGHG